MEEKNVFIAFFLKFWAYLFYIMIGIVAKFSFDLIRGKKISLMQAVGITGLSVFVGFLASLWSIKHNPDNAGIIVPIATLAADKIVTSIMALNWGKITSQWLGWWVDFFKNKE